MNKISLFILLGWGAFAFIAASSVHKGYRSPEELKADTLTHQPPSAIGIDAAALNEKIDVILQEALRERAAPGAVVLVAKDKRIILEKAYGFHTYSGQRAVKTDDLFDLASVSKIAATTLAMMKLTEEKKLDLNAPIAQYLPETKASDKGEITLKSLMLHESGLISFIPFHRLLLPQDHSKDSSAAFPSKVAPGYFVAKDYLRHSMWPKMLASPLAAHPKYVYSDLSMYFIQQVIERQSRQGLQEYVQENFYRRLGLSNTLYNPWKSIDPSRIVPTEKDGPGFRDTLLRGYVHDQGAALAGGVAGHAGLFSNARELAILGQLLLNRGSYNEITYFKPETVDLFSSSQSSISRRGLGFDRRDPDPEKQYPSRLASASIFGHTGYTGTAFWIDPEYQLIYIFLSNRVHPQVSDRLSELNIRSRVLDAVYEEIERAPDNTIK